MVVGTTPYRDVKEAYPLDRKTLRKIALRSFLMDASVNAETGSSIGWTWAMMPGLEKIHTDEADFAISLGQNLEYNEPGTLFPTFLMGITLAAESQKMDPAIIRSIRTAGSIVCRSLDLAVLFFTLVPLLAGFVSPLTDAGNWVGVLVYYLVLAVLTAVLRFTMIGVGYRKGTAWAEKTGSKKKELRHAARIAGIFMIGAFIPFISVLSPLQASYSSAVGGYSISLQSSLTGIFPGVIGIAVTLCSYHLLTKKNWSLAQCVLILIPVGIILGLL